VEVIHTIDMTSEINQLLEESKVWRFIYLETPGHVSILAEEDVEDESLKKLLRMVRTNEIFTFLNEKGRGFIVEANACDPADVVAQITYHLQEFREIYPQKL
jgi:stage III sporulation protein SpoIIIAA